MPIEFIYDPAVRILFTRACGLVTFAEIQHHLDREVREDALGHRELFDASDAHTNVTADEVRAVVKNLQGLMQKERFGPTAVVTDNDNLFGMASMLSILLDLQAGPSVSVFRTFNEALHWLLRV